MSNDTKKRQTFEEFASQYTSEYLSENYKKVVKDFSIKENEAKKRKVKPPLMIYGRPLVSYYSLEQYKAMTQEAINTPLANREGVINKLLDNYINKPLKQTKSDASKIYDNIRSQAGHTLTGNKFLYYSNLIAIEELIKFEIYLLNGCKDEQKELTLKNFFPTLQPQQIEKLQKEFSDSRGIEMACFIHQINKDGKLSIIKNTEKSFKSFLKMFGNIPENKHEAVRKCFNSAVLYGDFDLINDNNLETYNTINRINTALKVG